MKDLQFAGTGFLTGKHDFQVAVAAPQGVNKVLFFRRIFQGNLPGEFVKAAHSGGFYAAYFMAGSIGFQRFVKYLCVVQIFRNGNMQDFIPFRMAGNTKTKMGKEQAAGAQNQGK